MTVERSENKRVYRWENCSLVLQMAACWAAASVARWAVTKDASTAEKTAARSAGYLVALMAAPTVETMDAS